MLIAEELGRIDENVSKGVEFLIQHMHGVRDEENRNLP
jgi:hypothetical protein